MMSLGCWNTKEKGVLQFFLYKKKNFYVGVCLNLDIVEYGKDPKQLMQSVEEAAKALLQTVQKDNLSDELLNKPAPKEHWEKFDKYISALSQRSRLCDVDLENGFMSVSQNLYNGSNFVGGC